MIKLELIVDTNILREKKSKNQFKDLHVTMICLSVGVGLTNPNLHKNSSLFQNNVHDYKTSLPMLSLRIYGIF